ncbi:MAG TPA: endopeptidase La, partial [Sulfurihydrogenibium azorense]|nr:endopeptidase La [Sulfurihydrogenibium azorense]
MEERNLDLPSTYPLIPTRDVVVFPYMVMPLFIGRQFSIKAVEEAIDNNNRYIFLALQKDKNIEEPTIDDIHQIGVVATIIRMMKLEDERVKILVQGVTRGRIKSLTKQNGYYQVEVDIIEDEEVEETIEVEALKHSTKDLIDKAISLGKQIIPDLVEIIKSIEEPGRLADVVASVLDLKPEEGQAILDILDPVERLRYVHDKLLKEVGILEIQHKIRVSAREAIEKDQREYFLRQQIKAIQEELGEKDDKKEEIES